MEMIMISFLLLIIGIMASFSLITWLSNREPDKPST